MPPATNTPLQGFQREIILRGDLASLEYWGRRVWEAVAIECYDSSWRLLARLPVVAERDTYWLPWSTHWVKLWIGEELEGAHWWKEWDCQFKRTNTNPIELVIVRILFPTPTPSASPR